MALGECKNPKCPCHLGAAVLVAQSSLDDKPYTSNDSDLVNHPSHYTFGRFEVIDVLEDWFSDDPLLWQVVKYLARAKHKGNLLQDLEKAQFYLQRRIESEKN